MRLKHDGIDMTTEAEHVREGAIEVGLLLDRLYS